MTRYIECLDKGFVGLVDMMGDDQAIVDAARVSIAGEGVKAVNRNRGLIRYLIRNQHSTPVEQVQVKLHIKCPLFITRQWQRHRTWAYWSLNEMSARYSVMPEEWYEPSWNDVQLQAKGNNQGRAEEGIDGRFAWEVKDAMNESCLEAFERYSWFIENDIARELARIVIPFATYTEFYASVNLWNLFHFLGLRQDSHAQYEIRVYADAIAELIKEKVPIAWEAFEDYYLEGMYLSKQDQEALVRLLNIGYAAEDSERLDVHKTKREKREFKEKLERLQRRFYER